MTYATGTVTITVDNGYDLHAIVLSGRTYRRIMAGEVLKVRGQGFTWDERREQDYWVFNRSQEGKVEVGAIYVFTEGGGEVFSGSLAEDDVAVEAGP